MARKDASIQRVTYNRGEKVTGALMSLPAIILLIAFLIIPIVYTIFYSLFQYQVVRPDSMEFIGLENYLEVFQTEEFYVALRNTFYFTVLVVPIQCVLALCLALLVRSRRRGVSIFRTMYFAPQVTSMVVIAVLWTVLYNSNANTGLINALLSTFGAGPVNFLGDPDVAMNAIIFMSAWQGAGYQMMIFLAGLQGIPEEQYEAASIDGAGRWAQFRYVTLPGLANTTKYVLMITIIQAMKLFTQPYIMTKGGPQKCDPHARVLHLRRRLPERQLRLCLRNCNGLLCARCHHFFDCQEIDQNEVRKGEKTLWIKAEPRVFAVLRLQ